MDATGAVITCATAGKEACLASGIGAGPGLVRWTNVEGSCGKEENLTMSLTSIDTTCVLHAE